MWPRAVSFARRFLLPQDVEKCLSNMHKNLSAAQTRCGSMRLQSQHLGSTGRRVRGCDIYPEQKVA